MTGLGVILLLGSLAAGFYAFNHAHNFPNEADEIAVERGLKVMVCCAILAAILMFAGEARAHDAIPTAAKPNGWTYPFQCCSGYDCREVSSHAIGERPEGYVIAGTGEVIAYGDRRIKDSPDGVFHWCSVAGKDDGKTICLFVPPRGF